MMDVPLTLLFAKKKKRKKKKQDYGNECCHDVLLDASRNGELDKKPRTLSLYTYRGVVYSRRQMTVDRSPICLCVCVLQNCYLCMSLIYIHVIISCTGYDTRLLFRYCANHPSALLLFACEERIYSRK